MDAKKPVVGVTPYMHDDGTRYVPEGYLTGIIDTGCEPLVIDYMTVKVEELPAIVEKLDAMVFSGGVDVDPKVYGEEEWPETGRHVQERDEIEVALARMLIKTDMPVLGICRGLQIVNAALGGTLVQHVPKVYGDSLKHQQKDGDPTFIHPVSITPGSRVAEIFGETEFMIDSYHHQSAKDAAPGFEVVAKAPDGCVEALELPGDRFFVLLQWHPEKTLYKDEYSIKPFQALRKAIDNQNK
ncbi:MAG: gamma-glutamyl-gamma-aminobutyrate hydrolase family protein [Clostridia bacterium]|nr:gamma-glutamyl-gamma-aminobutyrate hydrolase family protein [Clostridia bacterium]